MFGKWGVTIEKSTLEMNKEREDIVLISSMRGQECLVGHQRMEAIKSASFFDVHQTLKISPK